MQSQSQSNYPYQSSSTTQSLTPEGLRTLEDVAQRHGVSFDAVVTLLDALNRGNGTQAQFNHWDLGGMGQWSQGGMIMIGDMFNQSLKYRVSNLCSELSNILRNQPLYKAPEPSPSNHNVSLFVVGGGSTPEWPAEFGYASTSGAQNNLSYAYFPSVGRLCIKQDGRVRIFDTGQHHISGVSQQQGGDQTLTFTSQFGLVRITELPEISLRNAQTQAPAPVTQQPDPPFVQPVFSQPAPSFSPDPAQPAFSQPGSPSPDEIVKLIERLADLHKKSILSNEEYASKKAELLSRL